MCDFLLESVPNKNMVLCSPGERVNGSCGMRPGMVDQLADKQGCGILHPEIWRQALSGAGYWPALPPAGAQPPGQAENLSSNPVSCRQACVLSIRVVSVFRKINNVP